MTIEQLEEYRHQGNAVYGYKYAFCHGNNCCERCDSVVRFWCRVICKIERFQVRRILSICKKEKLKGEANE